MREFIPKLTARLSPTPRKFNMGPRITSTPDSDTDKITHKYLWRRISQFLDKNSIIVAETGTSSFGCFNMAAPDGTLFINQILWYVKNEFLWNFCINFILSDDLTHCTFNHKHIKGAQSDTALVQLSVRLSPERRRAVASTCSLGMVRSS